MGPYVVWKSELIRNADEARNYYANRWQGDHLVVCYGRHVTINFPPDCTHTYSEEIEPHNAAEPKVQRRFPGGETEVRAFCLDRARLIDQIIPAICRFHPSLPSRITGGRKLYGPPLPDGRRVCVVLRPTNDRRRWKVVTAFSVTHQAWIEACRSGAATFPPR